MNLYWKNKPEKIDPSLLSDKKIVDKLNVYPNQKTKNILIRSDNKVGISSLIVESFCRLSSSKRATAATVNITTKRFSIGRRMLGKRTMATIERVISDSRG